MSRPDAFRLLDGGVEWHGGHETVLVRAFGPNGIRVQAALGPIRQDRPGALLEAEGSLAPDRGGAAAEVGDGGARVLSGNLQAHISPSGEIAFYDRRSGLELLAEKAPHFWWPGARVWAATGNGYHRIEQRFAAYDGERLYGLGQHTDGLFDHKGAVVDLLQRNGEVTIPFLVSSRGYGLLWNSPAVGRVELGRTGTRWVADSALQLDYWLSAGSPAEVLGAYGTVTGKAPRFPRWASGFWQSKLRYRTQHELLEVAREYRRRGLPLSVIVCDFFHGTHVGDFCFDPAEWPDPSAMVAELESLGVKLMVSVWPTTTTSSPDYLAMRDEGLFLRNERGVDAGVLSRDKGAVGRTYSQFYDATNPRARADLWDKLREGYYRHGISIFWLDASEPELQPFSADNLLFYAGPGSEVANLYPRENSRAVWEGMRSEGEHEVLTLNRSAWAGSQRYGAAVWSGDIDTDFASLRQQLRAGLSMAVSGIPWWTTDIGGFHGGDAQDPEFRELIVRWFQFGVFCPITRLHGDREPRMEPGPEMTGGANEVWSFGEEVYGVLAAWLSVREQLRPYVDRQAQVTSDTGLPMMRPLFVAFPGDPLCWDVEDEYLFGEDLLVAPVTEHGGRSRSVYLPAGTSWREVWGGEVVPGGTTIEAAAPLARIPVFERSGAAGVGVDWAEAARRLAG